MIKGHNGILYEIIPGKLKYKLLKDAFIDTGIKKSVKFGKVELKTTGRLHLRKGFKWNGANCFPDFDSIMRGSAFHDALYELIILELIPIKYRLIADILLKKLCIEDKMNRFLARLVFHSCRLFGLNHVKNIIKILKEKDDNRSDSKKNPSATI